MALQSSPIVLTLVIAATIAHGLFALSTVTVLGAAIAALGLANGSNAGQAIGEAMWSLRAEGAQSGLFGRALSRAATQIVAFLINRQGHADRKLHRGARTAQFAHRHHLILERPDHDLQHPADLLHRRGAGGGLAVRQAQADPRTSAGRSMSGLMDLLG